MVDRRGSAGIATFFVDATPAIGTLVALPESAVRHANVRRLEAGDEVRLTDGAGTVAHGHLRRMDHRAADVEVEQCESMARPLALTLLVPVADRDRMLWLAEKAAELAITDWRPVMYARSRSVSPRGEGAGFARKIAARMASALEQSGGAWLPELHGDASLEEAIEACEAARIWELISSLPDGLDTIAGDRGYRFSGGEKQRLALARLLLKAPSVVVLDEATAHLDSESEAAIQRALATALAGRTSLVIAHRLSTVRAADQILVIDGGQIAERGTHDELLAAGGVYAGLYRTQFAPQAALRSFPEEGSISCADAGWPPRRAWRRRRTCRPGSAAELPAMRARSPPNRGTA